MRRVLLLLCALVPGIAAAAGHPRAIPAQQLGGNAIVYTRDKVVIEVKAAPVTEPKNTVPTGPTEKHRYSFDTDIRPEESLQVDWFYSLADIREGRAALVVLKEAAPITLPEAKLYKPVDILLIGDDGSILAILPYIVLATLEKRLKLDLPVKALMYLGGGVAKTLGIAPKDRIVHKMFVADPVVIQ